MPSTKIIKGGLGASTNYVISMNDVLQNPKLIRGEAKAPPASPEINPGVQY